MSQRIEVLAPAEEVKKMFPQFTPGEWYLTVTCSNCNIKIPVFHDLSNGESEIVGGYTLTCPFCGEKRSYSRDQVSHYQHPRSRSRAA